MFERFEVLNNVELKNYSTIKIGGKIDFIVFPRNFLEILEVLKEIYANDMPYFVLGNGSNILFAEESYKKVALSLKNINKVFREESCVWCGAGINAFSLNQRLSALGLGGFEWSYGIPATLGGMVVCNAGCFGSEIGNLVDEVLVIDNGRLKKIKKEELMFSYRSVKYKDKDLKNFIVVAVKLKLFPEKNEKIKENMQNFYNLKKSCQPCDKPSLGSVFKRIEGSGKCYVAKIIDNLGLKGVKIGGAEVSTKHSGFIINSGNATAEDVLQLVSLIESGLADCGIFPEREIEVLVE